MSGSNLALSELRLVGTFDEAASHSVRQDRKRKPPPPFSIRFTEEERKRLDRDAGVLSLAAYMRLKLFCESDKPTSKRYRTRKPQQPSAELTMLSHMLGGLGKSRMAANLDDIAEGARTGALDMTDELAAEVREACAAIRHMDRLLIVALGVKPEDGQ